jgi:hypothetical protein
MTAPRCALSRRPAERGWYRCSETAVDRTGPGSGPAPLLSDC